MNILRRERWRPCAEDLEGPTGLLVRCWNAAVCCVQRQVASVSNAQSSVAGGSQVAKHKRSTRPILKPPSRPPTTNQGCAIESNMTVYLGPQKFAPTRHAPIQVHRSTHRQRLRCCESTRSDPVLLVEMTIAWSLTYLPSPA